MASNDQTNQPSLVGGHAEYVKGAAQSAVGSVTGSEAWTASGEQAKAHAVSGEQAKAHAVSDMKAAGQARDAPGQGLGKAEEMAGKAVGCEGMVREGEESKKE